MPNINTLVIVAMIFRGEEERQRKHGTRRKCRRDSSMVCCRAINGPCSQRDNSTNESDGPAYERQGREPAFNRQFSIWVMMTTPPSRIENPKEEGRQAGKQEDQRRPNVVPIQKQRQWNQQQNQNAKPDI